MQRDGTCAYFAGSIPSYLDSDLQSGKFPNSSRIPIAAFHLGDSCMLAV
jgi:hypothetical protein